MGIMLVKFYNEGEVHLLLNCQTYKRIHLLNSITYHERPRSGIVTVHAVCQTYQEGRHNSVNSLTTPDHQIFS